VRDSVDAHVETWARELEWTDPVQEAILARLAILARHIGQNRADVLDAGGLRRWEFKVLLTLRRLGPPYTASPSQLADHLGLTRGALSARLAPLEEAGLLTRTNESGDRRRVLVQLTPAGSAAFERQVRGESEREAAMLAPLTPAEQKTLARLLRKLLYGLESSAGARPHL
jgi:DNA-binding MarR family transcriptional regulator